MKKKKKSINIYLECFTDNSWRKMTHLKIRWWNLGFLNMLLHKYTISAMGKLFGEVGHMRHNSFSGRPHY